MISMKTTMEDILNFGIRFMVTLHIVLSFILIIGYTLSN